MARKEVFTTHIGLHSMLTDRIILVTAIYLSRFAVRHMREEERKTGR